MRPLIPFVLALLAAPALAQEMRYDDCLALIETDPQAARAAAIDWFEATGRPAAAHCEAMALTRIGALGAAANRLQEAAAMSGLPAETRADLLTQAAALWRGMGRTAEALLAIDAAIAHQAGARRYLERAGLLTEMGDLGGARAALDRALTLAPDDAGVLTASAADRLRTGDAAGARGEALSALALDTGHAGSWLVLGEAERALGRRDAARRAWLKAIELEPDGVGLAARDRLQEMDGG